MAKDNGNIPDITFSGDITVNGPMFDIHDNEHVYIGRSAEKATNIDDSGKNKRNERNERNERKEKQCFFIHPAVSNEEKIWAIHDEIKRLVSNQGIQDICKYLTGMQAEKKILQPQSAETAYNELVRMGMPNTDGFNIKTFMKYYRK